jgi:AraC-like DNA-binding protein
VSDFLYPEWGNLRFNLYGDMVAMLPGLYPPGPQLATLFGPTDREAQVTSTSASRIAGIGFTPLGWNRFIALPADELANTIKPLEREFGLHGDDWRKVVMALGNDDDAILDQFDATLSARLSRTQAPDPVTLRLDEVLRTNPHDVASFAAMMAMSPRTLSRYCARVFGFAPKRLLRRQRFLDTLGQVRTQPDAKFIELLDERYFDQSHFIRDFRAFMGMAPRAYLARPRDIFQVAAVEQASRGITLSFRLPGQPT